MAPEALLVHRAIHRRQSGLTSHFGGHFDVIEQPETRGLAGYLDPGTPLRRLGVPRHASSAGSRLCQRRAILPITRSCNDPQIVAAIVEAVTINVIDLKVSPGRNPEQDTVHLIGPVPVSNGVPHAQVPCPLINQVDIGRINHRVSNDRSATVSQGNADRTVTNLFAFEGSALGHITAGSTAIQSLALISDGCSHPHRGLAYPTRLDRARPLGAASTPCATIWAHRLLPTGGVMAPDVDASRGLPVAQILPRCSEWGRL